MILNLHGEALVGRVERWAFGYGPGLEHAFHFEPEVVVQAGSPVLLHHEAVAGFLLQLGGRLRRLFEAALTLVLFEGHKSILNAKDKLRLPPRFRTHGHSGKVEMENLRRTLNGEPLRTEERPRRAEDIRYRGRLFARGFKPPCWQRCAGTSRCLC